MPNVVQITYTCQECGREEEEIQSFICKCGGEFKGTGFPGLTGTRDNFGIRHEFYDQKTGQYIDTFKKWERAGYKQPGDVNGKQSKFLKERIKEVTKHKTYQTKSKAIELAERI